MKSRRASERASGSEVSVPKMERLEERILLSLLGIAVELPTVNYDANGVMAYNATAGTFDSDAAPVSIQVATGVRPVRVLSPSDFQLHFRADNTGAVLGGVEGNDFSLSGRFDADVNGDGALEHYEGVLLTGEVLQFGFLDTGTPTDQYDFRLLPTGGALVSFFAGKDIGMRMTSLNSTFTGSFDVNFAGSAQGVLGPVELLAAGSLAGRAFIDANNNGADEAEAGINDVVVTLTGTDYRGSVVSRVLQTAPAAGVDGVYKFENLLPGTYAIQEAQPTGYLDGKDIVGTPGGVLGDDAITGIALGAGFHGAGHSFGELLPASLSGKVWLDANNNGQVDSGEMGLAGVTLTLMGTDDRGAAVSLAATTLADGSYAFAGLRPGTYMITETQPAGYLDGKDIVGTPGGVLGDDAITGIALGAGFHGAGHSFGEILPATLDGFAWTDFNNDGLIDFDERAIEAVTVRLTGVNDRNNLVDQIAATDADGWYSFADLRPGTYTLTETQPAGYQDGLDVIGSAGGTAGNDVFSGIPLGVGVYGANYNFGERPEAGSGVTLGQTATIGYWQNKNGQSLIKSLNGGSTMKQLGNWLAATFSHMYAGLAGKTNAEVAQHYENLFRSKQKVVGPTKFDCQVMAVAFATYVTNSSLAGNVAGGYGFWVTEYGVGIATFNVGTSGAAFGVANGTRMTVLDMLLATNERSVGGSIYDMDAVLRRLANEVYTAINEAGDIV